MRLLGRHVLAAAAKKHADARSWLENWAAAIERAEWQNIDEVRKEYPSADGVKLPGETVVTVFNVKGNRYRLLAEIRYVTQIVEAFELLTHSEYSKGFWKARY